MTGLGQQIMTLARLSLQDPRAGARALLRLGVPMPARTLGLLLMAVASAVLMQVGFMILPPTDDPLAVLMMASPLRTAVIQWLILSVSVLLIYRVGRAWGGRGSLPDSLLVVVWLQVIMLGVQAVQVVALLIAPPVAAIINLAGLVLFFWLMTSFIAELHGFTSRGKVLAGILVTSFAVAMILVFLLLLTFGPEALGNV
ncbi:YIP1 family protein [Tabrizicola sp.]|uniref:YIP1 family protein n=1 Tax=Tabrizicola sp. TaxID=2005166 RepID=UPI0026139398|nr:YIP1 family protein [Tabrizicola sp.]MDM7930717.1 YIP1 family protein [Tabrizicola sp.]